MFTGPACARKNIMFLLRFFQRELPCPPQAVHNLDAVQIVYDTYLTLLKHEPRRSNPFNPYFNLACDTSMQKVRTFFSIYPPSERVEIWKCLTTPYEEGPSGSTQTSEGPTNRCAYKEGKVLHTLDFSDIKRPMQIYNTTGARLRQYYIQ